MPVSAPVLRERTPATKPTKTQKATTASPIQKMSGMSAGETIESPAPKPDQARPWTGGWASLPHRGTSLAVGAAPMRSLSGDDAIEEQQQQRATDREQPGADIEELVQVPDAEGAGYETADQGARDADQGRNDEATRIVTGHDQLRDRPRTQAEHNPTDDPHGDLLLSQCDPYRERSLFTGLPYPVCEGPETDRFLGVKLLAFSDLHRDLGQAATLVEMSAEADAVIAAGDFASVHEGLEETIAALAAIAAPTVLVPGNNETEEALREATAGWDAATVLHGGGATIDGVEFFGLGGGIPVTPWDWSFDLDEESATEKLAPCPQGAVLVLHSPPKGHCDAGGSGDHFGSEALLGAIEEKAPRLAVCGHIHESWGCESLIGDTPLHNLGPTGRWLEI